jgi:hypothetical protein
LRVSVINTSGAIKELARITSRSLLGYTVSSIKLHVVWASRDRILRDTSGAVKDKARCARRTISRDTVHSIKGTSSWTFGSCSRGAVVMVVVGTRLADGTSGILAVSTNECRSRRTFGALI